MLAYDTNYDVSMKDLILGIRLGSGAFGEVLQAEVTGLIQGVQKTTRLVNGKQTTTVAVKRLQHLSKDDDLKAFIAEMKIMIYIGKHQNVVSLLGVVRENLNNRKILHTFIIYLH